MADCSNLAVAIGADSDALDRGGPMRGVVEHQRPRQRNLDWTAGRTRAERREQSIGSHEQLAAKAAAYIGRDEPDVLLRYAERQRDVFTTPVDHLVRGPQRKLVAAPHRHRR